ncbi:hypothetical protein WMF30_10310 [Sorangium sp. So ce134]
MSAYRQVAEVPDVVAMRPVRNGDRLPVSSVVGLMHWLLPAISNEEADALARAAKRELLQASTRAIRAFVPRALSTIRGRVVELCELSVEELAALPRWDEALDRYDPS